MSLVVLLCQGIRTYALWSDLPLWERRTYWKWSLTFPLLLTSLCLACPVGPLIGKYCGTKTPSELRSSTEILSLTFHTDMAVAKDGFSARYYLVPQEPLESELAVGNLCLSFQQNRKGVLTSPGQGAWWEFCRTCNGIWVQRMGAVVFR